jgi:serine/threonine-protein kinase
MSILLRIGYGLAAAHERDLFHRDVKPSNILIENETGRPVLIDFGLVRRKGSTPSLAVGGGTPCYMPPEQATDVDGTLIGPTADVYALACTAFEMLTNQPLFDGPTAMAILQAHRFMQPPRVSLHRPELEPLDRVLLRALSKKASDRHPSAKAFVDDLANAAKRVKKASARPALPVRREPLRVIVLMNDDALRRHVLRIVERTVDAGGDFAAIESVSTTRELASAFEREAAPIVVVDRECAPDVRALVTSLRQTARCPEVLVLSRKYDFASPCSDDPDVKEIPKPINAQVMASVISKMAARVALRRVTEPPA